MPQFDVYATRGAAARLAPFVVAIQASLLAGLNTVVVAPMHLPKALSNPVRGLHVPVQFAGKPYVIAIEQLVSLPTALLGKATGTLAAEQQAIKQAIDLLFFGI